MSETRTIEQTRHGDGQVAQPAKRGLRLERRVDRRLWAVTHDDARPVRPRRLFPWSRQSGHVSLRDPKNHEFAVVAVAEDLDDRSRAALAEALDETDFIFQVTRVLDISEEVEIRIWDVETRQGSRTFQTRLDDWPRAMPHGEWLIRDVAGDLYRVPPPETLDPRSRERLWAFTD